MFSYKKLIASAFNVVIHHKYLWFFGFFVAFLADGGIVNKIYSGNSSDAMQNWRNFKNTGIFNVSIFHQIANLAHTDLSGLLISLAVLLLVLVLGIFILWLAVVSQGSLIKAVANITSGRQSNFDIALKTGISYFWPIFFFKLLGRITMFACAALFIVIFSYAVPYLSNIWINLGITLLIVIIFIIIAFISLVIRYAMSYSVIKEKRFIDALIDGYQLLQNNIILSLETVLVIFVLNVFCAFLLLIGISALFIPMILLMFLFYHLSVLVGVAFVVIMGTLLLFLSVALGGAILFTFTDALWTIFFINIAKTKSLSRLGRIKQLIGR